MTRITRFILLQTNRLVALRLDEPALLEAVLLISPPTPLLMMAPGLEGDGTRWLALKQCSLFNPRINLHNLGLSLGTPLLDQARGESDPETQGSQVGSPETLGFEPAMDYLRDQCSESPSMRSTNSPRLPFLPTRSRCPHPALPFA